MPKKRSKIWKFTAPLERMDSEFAWYYVEFPHDVQQEFGTRSRVRVKTVINGIPADRALMPTRSGFHMIVLGGELRRAAKLRSVGDKVNVELWLDPEPDRIDIPEELAETLDFMPEYQEKWKALKPGMQRSMCYWISSGKTLQTRSKRVAEILRRFDSGDFHFGEKKQDP